MSIFNPLKNTKKAPLTEMSPLFHVMQNIQYKYTEIQDEERIVTEDASNETEERSRYIINRNGWFTKVTPGNSQEKNGSHFMSSHAGILFVAMVICVGLGFALTSISSSTAAYQNPWQPISPQATKMTLIPIETVDNVRSVKVVAMPGESHSGNEEILAQGVYVTNYEGNGWNHLRVHMPNIPLTNDYDYFAKYFMGWEAMGFLEGYVTCTEMQNYYVNLYHGLFDGGDIMPEAVNFLVQNHDWVRQQAEANWRTSEYWLAIKATLVQLTGVLNGLRQGCPSAAGGSTEFDVYSSTSIRTLHDFPTLVNLLILNANGDLYQIAAKYNQQNAPASNDDDYQYTNPPPPVNGSTFFDDDNHIKSQIRVGTMFESNLRAIRENSLLASKKQQTEDDRRAKLSPSDRRHIGSDHCSALIRLLPDNSDIFFAHNTWDDFQNAAPRIFKQYSFPQPHYRRAQGVNTAPANQNDGKSSGDTMDGGNVNNGASSPQVEAEEPLMQESGSAASGAARKSSPSTAPSASAVPPTQTFSVLSSTMVDIHFSSSPGFLSSVDDYYTISGNGNLAVIETSLDIYDSTLLTQIHYDSVLSWMRVRVANNYAISGDHWSRLFAMYHSGTYVNQWLVLDFAKFTPSVAPVSGSGLLTVLEEMPGYIFWEDVTSILVSQGYWASFNDAYFEVVRQVSGAELMCEENTNYCYQTDPRNLIFTQRAPNVNGLDDMKKLIRYNNWEHDPIAHNDSCLGSISCRMDLQPDFNDQYPFGALDAKVSSITLASRLHNTNNNGSNNGKDGSSTDPAGASSSFLPTIWTIMGPTHDQQPVFCWDLFDVRRDVRGKKFSHLGAPQCFDYEWIKLPPPKNYRNVAAS